MDALDFDDIQTLAQLGCDEYLRRVITLFLTHRATPEHYAAMAEAVRACSESSEGDIVACIDRAVLALKP